jgi:hypothetical protein
MLLEATQVQKSLLYIRKRIGRETKFPQLELLQSLGKESRTLVSVKAATF